MGFKKKDIIRIRREVDANWIEGELNDCVGIFPRNYVEILDPGMIFLCDLQFFQQKCFYKYACKNRSVPKILVITSSYCLWLLLTVINNFSLNYN